MLTKVKCLEGSELILKNFSTKCKLCDEFAVKIISIVDKVYQNQEDYLIRSYPLCVEHLSLIEDVFNGKILPKNKKLNRKNEDLTLR